jgi:hypothetical protein
MSEQKHTPGPWQVAHDWHDEDESLDYMRVVADSCVIANTILEDDARLIAAAPELLESAKLVLAWYEAEEDFSKEPDFFKRVEMCRQSEIAIRAAIAKAEGK